MEISDMWASWYVTPMKGLFIPQRSHDPEVKKCCCSLTEGEKRYCLQQCGQTAEVGLVRDVHSHDPHVHSDFRENSETKSLSNQSLEDGFTPNLDSFKKE